jgi:hypothetical protein
LAWVVHFFAPSRGACRFRLRSMRYERIADGGKRAPQNKINHRYNLLEHSDSKNAASLSGWLKFVNQAWKLLHAVDAGVVNQPFGYARRAVATDMPASPVFAIRLMLSA